VDYRRGAEAQRSEEEEEEEADYRRVAEKQRSEEEDEQRVLCAKPNRHSQRCRLLRLFGLLHLLDYSLDSFAHRFRPSFSRYAQLPEPKGQGAQDECKHKNCHPKGLIEPAGEVVIGQTHQEDDLPKPEYRRDNHEGDNDNKKRHGGMAPHR
jgi:hypothetical protein